MQYNLLNDYFFVNKNKCSDIITCVYNATYVDNMTSVDDIYAKWW